jgi:hypothetical protein
MKNEYFPTRVKRVIEEDPRHRSDPTFQGRFVPDLINELKAHLRKVELAQIASVQQYKETVRSQREPGYTRPRGKVWEQIEAARRAR